MRGRHGEEQHIKKDGNDQRYVASGESMEVRWTPTKLLLRVNSSC